MSEINYGYLDSYTHLKAVEGAVDDVEEGQRPSLRYLIYEYCPGRLREHDDSDSTLDIAP